MEANPDSQLLVKKNQLARILGVSPRTVDTWIARQTVPYISPTPRLHLFDPVAVKAVLNTKFGVEAKDPGVSCEPPIKPKRLGIIEPVNTRVKVYPLRRKKSKYRSYQVMWYEPSGRQTKTFADPLKAEAHAQRVRNALLNQGRPREVDSNDILILRDAEAIAARFGVSVPFAIREWADTRALLGPSILGNAKSLADALCGVVEVKVADAVERYIESIRKAGMSTRHFQTLCTLLRPFAKRFGLHQLSQISVAEIENYFEDVPGGARTKNNVLATLKTLFIWAQRRGHLRADRSPVTHVLRKLRQPCPTPEIFTPEEMIRILAATRASEPAMLPFMVLGAFAGLRSAEIARLDWSAVDLNSGYIKVAWDIAKTRQRRLIPLQANLKAWLLLHEKREGAVAPGNHRRGIDRCARHAGLSWKCNGLRHSYGSYRLAVVQDAAKVSLEMGNSPEVLFKHYRELVTAEAGAKWFAILPP